MKYARSLLLLIAVIAVGSVLGTAQTAQAVTTIKIAEDQVALQFVGQFNNSGTSSQQFGYL